MRTKKNTAVSDTRQGRAKRRRTSGPRPTRPVPSRSNDDGSGVGKSETVTKSPLPLLTLKQARESQTLTLAVTKVRPVSASVSPVSLPVPNVTESVQDEPSARTPHPLDSDKKVSASELSPDWKGNVPNNAPESVMLAPELFVRVKVKTALLPSVTVTFGLLGVRVTPLGVAMAQAGQKSTKLNRHTASVSRELLNMNISSRKF